MQKKKYCPECASRLIEKWAEGRVRAFCESCDAPVYENPVPATCLVVVDDRERILLVERSVEPRKGFWCLPGGFIELGESPKNSALRELKEETGLTGRIHELLGVDTNHSDRYGTVLMVGYLVKKYSGMLTAADDASDAAYFPATDLPEIAFDSHMSFIRQYYSSSSTPKTVNCKPATVNGFYPKST
ncbi:MAG: NUDIX hydrolase [Desulfobacterales bacterium]|nr:NUDIX hydrolase [Desulfobacterales bacterium]